MSLEQREQSWLENAFVNLQEACERKDWATARAICEDVEAMSGSAYAFRRAMNLAMNKKMTPMDILSSQMDVISKGLRV